MLLCIINRMQRSTTPCLHFKLQLGGLFYSWFQRSCIHFLNFLEGISVDFTWVSTLGMWGGTRWDQVIYKALSSTEPVILNPQMTLIIKCHLSICFFLVLPLDHPRLDFSTSPEEGKGRVSGRETSLAEAGHQLVPRALLLVATLNPFPGSLHLFWM